MWRGISLANKCLLLFGGAVVLIVLAALSAPFFRMMSLVDEGQLEMSRQLTAVWERLEREGDAGRLMPARGVGPVEIDRGGVRARRLTLAQARQVGRERPFVASALDAFQSEPDRGDFFRGSWAGITREYRYARAVREQSPGAPLVGVILLERREFESARMLITNGVYLLGAGLLVLGLATLVFYLITHRLILDPVRELKETAERVRDGDFAVRSTIATGDEFEELAETFNAMLAEVVRSQDQLSAINRQLDSKLSELAERNSALYEAARLKSEFLGSISHELRTPLNSIIGFTDLLRDAAHSELEAGDDSTRLQKRVRYLDNINTASRNLLNLITGLLEMAKIEAGKVDLAIATVNVVDTCRALLAMVAVQAEKKGIELRFEVAGGDVPGASGNGSGAGTGHADAGADIPLIETDGSRLQQIVLNFLSNAVKFTPAVDPAGRAGRITLRVDRLTAAQAEGLAAEERVRISVIDTGPGIALEDQAKLFQKFTQLDAGISREHAGTGLGLAISRELAHVLQGEIQLVSEPGRGSMFSLILPLRLDRSRMKELKLEASLRAALVDRRG